jgi:cytoplasmic iron level regulating protein YaaA (DUF328/UPF0246 family)
LLILLPPSETKRDGGTGASLAEGGLEALSFPTLKATRKKSLAALASLSRNKAESLAALKISDKQAAEVERNRAVQKSPTMPAIERYTGVLYDGLAAQNLDAASRAFVDSSVVIQSALLGPVAASDLIPAYRLSFDTRLPKLAEGGGLKGLWAKKGAAALATWPTSREGGSANTFPRKVFPDTPTSPAKQASVQTPTLVLDLRSEGYSALSPLAAGPQTFYLRVVTKGENGALRALNHFNKKGKGEFVRALAKDSAQTSKISTLDELMAWGTSKGLVLELGAEATDSWPAELNLVVSGTLAKLC